MKTNVGTPDRIFRAVLGLVIIGLGFAFQSWWGLIGIIPLFTSVVSWCPAYMPFGISTCRTNLKESK